MMAWWQLARNNIQPETSQPETSQPQRRFLHLHQRRTDGKLWATKVIQQNGCQPPRGRHEDPGFIYFDNHWKFLISLGHLPSHIGIARHDNNNNNNNNR